MSNDPFLGEFRVECQGSGCQTTRVAYLPYALGLRLGDMAPTSMSDPSYGRCHKCNGKSLKIIETPPGPEPIPPVGFTKVPTE